MEDRFKFRLIKDGKIVGYQKFNDFYGYDMYSDTLESKENGEAWTSRAIKHDTKNQPTGLKDKNGKLIFEGDIIANGDTHGEDEEVVHECVFSEGAFLFDPFPKGNKEDPLIGYEEFLHSLEELKGRGLCEIVGNIYEQPELIKKESE